MSNPFQTSFTLGEKSADQRQIHNEPLRILFLTDLGDRCRSRTETPLASRPMRPVDVDRFDDLFEMEQPVFSSPWGDVMPRELDDLHPDELCRNLPVFQTLNDLCKRLRAPSSFEAAAREVRAMMQTDTAKATAETKVEDEDDADTLARLFGKSSEASPNAAAPPARDGFLNELMHKAVQAHIVPDADPRAEDYVKAVEAAATAHMRAVLHEPAFQSFEAAWRGLNLLVSNIETDVALSIHVWNVAKTELTQAIAEADASPEQSVLHQRIVEQRQDEPFTLIVSDITFGRESDDLRLLATLGAMAGRTGALVLAGVASDMIGAVSWEEIVKGPNAPLEPDTGWAALRTSGIGSRIVAVAPGFMLRTPYGKRLDPTDMFFEFEELEHPGDPQAPILWGTSSLLAAVLIAQSFVQDGWDARLGANSDFDDLPFLPYQEDGEKQMRPCAEVQLSDRAAEAVSDAGPIPVVAVRHQNVVRLSLFQSIAREGDAGRIGPFNI